MTASSWAFAMRAIGYILGGLVIGNIVCVVILDTGLACFVAVVISCCLAAAIEGETGVDESVVQR